MVTAALAVAVSSGELILTAEELRRRARLRISIKPSGGDEVSVTLTREQVAGLIFNLETWRRATEKRR